MRVDIQQRYIHEVAFWVQQNSLLRWTRYLIPRNPDRNPKLTRLTAGAGKTFLA